MGFVSEHFELLDGIARCVAGQFGTGCEVVLHDLTLPYGQTIVSIYNGHVTGRKVGDGGTVEGLMKLRQAEAEDQFGCLNRTEDGKVLRISHKYFYGEDGAVEGCLCINYDVTGLLAGQAAVERLTGGEPGQSHDIFTRNVDELLAVLQQQALASIGKDGAGDVAGSLTKEEKVAVVRYLDRKGAFLIKKSAEQVADFLGISRFTVYNYLNTPEAR